MTYLVLQNFHVYALTGETRMVNGQQFNVEKRVDFRRGMNGLVALVASALSADPYCGDVFVFRAKRLDRLRCIYWDGSGMILATKWLEAGKFVWPPIRDGAM